MKKLALEGGRAGLLQVVNAICEGRLRAEGLEMRPLEWIRKLPSVPSGFIDKLCDLIRSSPNVGALYVESSEFTLVINELYEAVARTRLHTLHLEVRPIGALPERSIDALIDALGRNPCLCAFSISRATEAQKEKIRRLVRANGMVAVRLAMGQAFANQVELPRDAGTGVASHLTGTEAQQLALLNRTMHQANMRGHLVGLVQQGDFQGITRLCERWAGMKIGLEKSVLDEVLDVAQSPWRRQRDKASQAEAARKVLQALANVKSDRVPRYVPSQAALAQLAQLAAEIGDKDLLALVTNLF